MAFLSELFSRNQKEQWPFYLIYSLESQKEREREREMEKQSTIQMQQCISTIKKRTDEMFEKL